MISNESIYFKAADLLLIGQRVILSNLKKQLALSGYNPKAKRIYLALCREYNHNLELRANNLLEPLLDSLTIK